MAYPQKRKRKPIYDSSTGEPPTEEEIEKMTKQAHNVVDYWLSASDRSRGELRTKVLNKGITEEICDSVLDSYEEKGWIDDRRFAENFIRSKMTYEKLGARAISFKLSQKGIDRDIIGELIEGVDSEESMENAVMLAERKARQNMHVEKQKRLQQIVRMLASKGYSDNIFGVAQEAIRVVDEEFSNE